MGYGLRVMSYELWIMGYELRVMDHGIHGKDEIHGKWHSKISRRGWSCASPK